MLNPEEDIISSIPTVNSSVSYTIGGVKVEFPVKAYPSQISMMDKIIRGCQKAQNCLLESPTGSGKTLALLCGAIAWQKAEASRLNEVFRRDLEKYMQKLLETQQKHSAAVLKTLEINKNESSASLEKVFAIHSHVVSQVEDSDPEEKDLFYPMFKRVKHTAPKSNDAYSDLKDNSTVRDMNLETQSNPLESRMSNVFEASKGLVVPQEPTQTKVPKIYVGTRTHKQIAQVVHELRKTKYNETPITILSSRTHSCIMENGLNPNMTKNDLCNSLLDPRNGVGCRYKNNVKMHCHHSMVQKELLPAIWDLEDLIQYGKGRRVCPYFTARELMNSASVIFCPYNYLIDPLIRNSLNISLAGAVLILDEAHNIEDTCREAASFSVEQKQIQDAIKNCEELKEESENKAPYETLIRIFSSLSLWIDQRKHDICDISDYDQGKLSIFGPVAVESFTDFEFGKKNYHNLENSLKMIEAEKQAMIANEDDGKDASKLYGTTKQVGEGLALILGYLYDEKYTCDYHVVIMKSFARHYHEVQEIDSSGWLGNKKQNQVSGWRYSMNFWCLNPAATFCEIKEKARSIILTSGTLSPIVSFQSELGADFPITLEASHIIDESQSWIGSLCTGPNRIKLDGTYKSINTYQFQDEIGHILVQLCSFVPHGILCFVPSYTLLGKLKERWQSIGLEQRIEMHKRLLWEPRRGDELKKLLENFYLTIKETTTTEVGAGVTGALLVAVCRGKVSEGLDFADKNARVVVTIGIPFPNVKDSQVILKKSYNDKHQHIKGLLNGHDWYQIQAYRSLNQALGRCIRHREDWGAILLIDSRFSNKTYYKGLSKWVRNRIQHYNEYNCMIQHLTTFIKHRLRIERESVN